MFSDNLLRGKIAEYGTSQRKLAYKMGLNEKTFSEKMHGKYDWSLSEVQQLCKLLKINSAKEIKSIFFPEGKVLAECSRSAQLVELI